MSSKFSVLGIAMLAAVVGLALAADPAFADADQAGKEIGDVIRGLVTPVMLTIAGAVGIAALFRRDVALALVLVVLVIILSGFLMEGDNPIQNLGESIWNQIDGKKAQ